jgi:hypothetical protein
MWIEHATGSRSGSRFVKHTQPSQRGCQKEMSDRMISIGLNASTKLRNGIPFLSEMEFGDADVMGPKVGVSIARRNAKRFPDVSLGFLAPSHKNLGEANPTVRGR